MKVLFPFVLFVLLGTVFAKTGDPCILPNGKNATCKPARLCHFIVNEIKKGNREAVNFVTNSKCGYDEERLVCCGSSSFLGPTIPTAPKVLEDFSNTELPDRTACGFEEITYETIYGGDATNFGELPWVAALEYNNTYSKENAGVQCGGSVINKRYVLTAAHCLGYPGLDLIGVRLGEWHVDEDPDCFAKNETLNRICAAPVQRFKIEKTIPHRFYDRDTKNNDIGLIKLERDIKFSKYVRPVCLPLPYIPLSSPGTFMTVSGWGTMDDKGTRSPVKLKVKVPLASSKECTKTTKTLPISSNQICAGGERGKDACNGDSGGPLVVPYRDELVDQMQWYQEGIVSWSSGCAFEKPAVYTRVRKYMKWIIRNIDE